MKDAGNNIDVRRLKVPALKTIIKKLLKRKCIPYTDERKE